MAVGHPTVWSCCHHGQQGWFVLVRQVEICQSLLWDTELVLGHFHLFYGQCRIHSSLDWFSSDKLCRNFSISHFVVEEEQETPVFHNFQGYYVGTLASCHLLTSLQNITAMCSSIQPCVLSPLLISYTEKILMFCYWISGWHCPTTHWWQILLVSANMKSKPFISWVFYQPCYLLAFLWVILAFWCQALGLFL